MNWVVWEIEYKIVGLTDINKVNVLGLEDAEQSVEYVRITASVYYSKYTQQNIRDLFRLTGLRRVFDGENFTREIREHFLKEAE